MTWPIDPELADYLTTWFGGSDFEMKLLRGGGRLRVVRDNGEEVFRMEGFGRITVPAPTLQ